MLLYNGIGKADFMALIILPGFGCSDFRFGVLDINTAPLAGGGTRRIATVWVGQKHVLWDDGDGFQWAGNQQFWESFVQPFTWFDQGSGWITNGIEFGSEDLATTTLQPTDYIHVTGPQVDIINNYYNEEPDFRTISGDVVLTDVQIDNIDDWSVYTFTRFSDPNNTPGDTSDDVQQETYTGLLAKRPNLSTVDITTLPLITSPTQAELQAYTSGPVTLTWSMPIGYSNSSVSVYWRIITAGGEREERVELWAGDDFPWDALTVTVDEPALGAGEIIVGINEIQIWTSDVFERALVTNLHP